MKAVICKVCDDFVWTLPDTAIDQTHLCNKCWWAQKEQRERELRKYSIRT